MRDHEKFSSGAGKVSAVNKELVTIWKSYLFWYTQSGSAK